MEPSNELAAIILKLLSDQERLSKILGKNFNREDLEEVTEILKEFKERQNVREKIQSDFNSKVLSEMRGICYTIGNMKAEQEKHHESIDFMRNLMENICLNQKNSTRKAPEMYVDFEKKCPCSGDSQIGSNSNVLSELREIRVDIENMKMEQEKQCRNLEFMNVLNEKKFQDMNRFTMIKENSVYNESVQVPISNNEVKAEYFEHQGIEIARTIPKFRHIKDEIIGKWKGMRTKKEVYLTFTIELSSNKLFWKYSVDGCVKESQWEYIGRSVTTKTMEIVSVLERNFTKTRFEYLNTKTVKTIDRYIEDGKLHVIIGSSNHVPAHYVYQKVF